jgi:uncharacterized protein (TIGR03086 family)
MERVERLVEDHRHACEQFSAVTNQVSPRQWDDPTPCAEWDARALVEHVIGFHDFLLLRPLGVRANRPRVGPAARWQATAEALGVALDGDGTIDRVTDLPGGGTSTPRVMLSALTTDVLVHTWDLAQSARVEPALDRIMCERSYEAAQAAGLRRGDMFSPEVPVSHDADIVTKLVAFYGRDPSWRAPTT